jgi:hypothetical protein
MGDVSQFLALARRVGRLIALLFMIGVSLAFIGAGFAGLALGGWLWLIPTLELSRLPSVTAAALPAMAAGQRVFVEGTISEANPRLARSFVAYERTEFRGVVRGSSGRSGPFSPSYERWEVDERVTPPLGVETARGAVQIVNDAYEIRGPSLVWWRETEPPVWEEAQRRGSKRYMGIESGASVLVLGEATTEGGVPGVRAEWLAAGLTRDGYMRELGSGWPQLVVYSLIPLAIGGVALVRLLRRGPGARRQARTSAPPERGASGEPAS